MKLKMLATMAVLILSAGLSQAQILGVSVKAVGSVTVKSAGGQDCLFIDLRLANSNEVPILMKQVSLKDYIACYESTLDTRSMRAKQRSRPSKLT